MPKPLHEGPQDYRLGWIGIIGIFVLPVIVVFVALLLLHPGAATHISNAVEAEFGIAHAPAPEESPPVHAAVKAQ
jgi:hypothetical protein